MPIHLPPISRRQFLRRSVAACAGVAFAPSLFAASKKIDPNSWALLSDIHLAADRAKIARNINMVEHFATVSKELLSLPKRPAGVFINGDCAYNHGEPGDYATLADLLTPIREQQIPIHLALGNHDNRDTFWDAFQQEKAAKRPLQDKQATILQTPHANWFILDSLEKAPAGPGLLGKEQLDWLGKALDQNAKKPALVMIHHNPGFTNGNVGLKDTVELMEILRPRKQVKAYIFGHTHHWKVEQEATGIHLINLPPVAYLFHEGDPAGWVHATLSGKGMKLELRCIDTSHKAHGQIQNLEWRA